MGRTQYEHLMYWGLAAHHYLLDIGCGSLRGGRFAIKEMEPGHYYGIDPNQWLIDEGIRHELGTQIFEVKRPVFSNDTDFNLSVFGRKFDFLMAQSIFSHTSQSQMRKILSEAGKVMHDQAIFLATYIPGDSDYAGGWSYPDGVKFTFALVKRLASEAELECSPVKWFHTKQQWLVFYRSSNAEFVTERLRAASDRNSIRTAERADSAD
jgi:cyclopropane fatty-acyl-phospholipid synthase-like methyltransferase